MTCEMRNGIIMSYERRRGDAERECVYAYYLLSIIDLWIQKEESRSVSISSSTARPPVHLDGRILSPPNLLRTRSLSPPSSPS